MELMEIDVAVPLAESFSFSDFSWRLLRLCLQFLAELLNLVYLEACFAVVFPQPLSTADVVVVAAAAAVVGKGPSSQLVS